MAFLGQDDKQTQNQQNGQQAPGQNAGASTTPLTGTSQSAISQGSGVGTGASTVPASQSSAASGGGDGWTNIQNYLTANQGQTGSADALTKQVGGTFNQEKSTFDQDSGSQKSAAQAQLGGQMTQDQASKLLQDATSNYSYGSQNSNYQNDISQLQGGLNSTYQGPSSYSYGMGAQAQNYGSNLGSDSGFRAIMNALYDQSSSGAMSSGSKALQQQLDNNNSALQAARGSLQSQYNGLQGYENQGVQDTNSALQSAAGQYAQNTAGLKSMLNTAATNDQGAIGARIAADNAYLARVAPMGNYYPDQQNNIYTEFTYDPSGGPTASNVAGVDQQRNEFNAVQDALGTQGAKINQTAAYDPASALFKYQTYDNNALGGAGTATLADLPLHGIDYNTIASYLSGGPIVQTPSSGAPGRQIRMG